MYGGSNDIAVNYVLDVIDKGSAKALDKDRAIRKSVGDTTTVMQRQAEAATRQAQTITTAADREARAYSRTGLSSFEAATKQRESSTVAVGAIERTAGATEDLERRAKRSFNETQRHAGQLHGSLRQIARAGAALGGTYLGYSAGKNAIEQTLSLAKATLRLHNATGLADRSASGLLSVTRAWGLSDRQLETALGILAVKTDAVTKGTVKQKQSIADLTSVAHTFTGKQRELADVALHAVRGSEQQVQALADLKKSLADNATAHAEARAGQHAATLSQAQAYTMTKQQIAAWHDQQSAASATSRVEEIAFKQRAGQARTAVDHALAQAKATQTQADAFHRLGLSQADVQRGSRDMDFLLRRVGEGLAALPGGTDRTALGRQLFGRGASQLMPIVTDYEQQIRLAQQYGATLDGHTIKSLDQLEEANRRVHLSNTALKISFTQAVEPALLSLAGSTTKITKLWSGPGSFDEKIKGTEQQLAKLDIGGHLADAIRVGLPIAANAMAHGAPMLAKAFFDAFIHAGPAGDAVMLAWGAKKLGLWGTLGKSAGKAFFTAFLGEEAAKKIFGGTTTGAGKVSALLGATPETAMWVRVVNGIPGSGLASAEKTAAGAGAASAAGGDAAAELPRFMRFIPGVGSDLGAADVAAAGAGAFLSGAAINKGLDLVGIHSTHADKLSGLPVGGGTHGSGYDQTNTFIHQVAAHATNQKQLADNIKLTKDRLAALNAEEDKAIRMGGDVNAITSEDNQRRQALQHTLAVLKAQLAATGASAAQDFTGPVGRALTVTEGNFQAMRSVTRDHLTDIARTTNQNATYIAKTLGTQSAAGKQALAQNFEDAATAIAQAMRAGRASTQTGMQAIDTLLTKRLELYGLTPEQAKHAATYTAGPGHAATGGYIRDRNARGGDSVPIWVGAGESVNTTHQQAAINTGLAIAKASTRGRFPFGNLDQIYSNITARHTDAAAYAQGGIVSQVGLGGVHAGVLRAAGMIESRFPGLTITSSTGGGHATGSYHYLGEALDIGGAPGLMNRAAAWILSSGLAHNLTEGIHNPNLSIKYGKPVAASYWGPAVWAEHANHIHIAVAGALGKIARGALASPGSSTGRRFHPLLMAHTRLGGQLGAVVQDALNLDWAAANHVAKLAFTHGNSTGPVKGGVATLSQLEAAWSKYGPRPMAWIMGQIALAESGGRLNATNVNTNGTIDRGPWQANSTWGRWSTMSMGNLDAAARAADHIWRTQGLSAWTSDRAFEKYVRGRHPTGPGQFAQGGYAWGGWHATGTDQTVNRPTIFGAGERGPERVTIQPLARAASNVATGRGAIETWDHYLADVHLKKWVAELEHLGVSGEAKRRAKVILEHLPAALAQESFGQLTAIHRELQKTVDAHHSTSQRLGDAQKRADAAQKAIDSARKSGASQATIDQLTAAHKTAEQVVKSLSKKDSRLTAEQSRLTQALKAVERAQGTMIDQAAKRAQHLADSVNETETRTQRLMRRKNIDAASSTGLQLELKNSAGETKRLASARDQINAQITRARKLGDHSRVSSLLDQRRQITDQLDETRTTQIERRRQLAATRAQEAVDNATFTYNFGQAGLTAYNIAHRGDLNTAAGMRGQAAAISSTVPALQAQLTAIQNQVKVAWNQHDVNGWRTAMQAAADATNQLAQAQADAADLITQAARQQAQDLVDNASYDISSAQGGLQGLQISQQLMGTAGTAGGNQQISDYITKTLVPAMREKLQADQAKLAELQSEPNKDLQAIHQTLLDIQSDNNDIGQAQLDAQNAIKDNTSPLKDFGGSTAFDFNGQTETDASFGTGL